MLKLEQLQEHIVRLAYLKGDSHPVVSCYVDLTSPEDERRTYLTKRATTILDTWPLETERPFLVDAMSSVLAQANQKINLIDKGLAVFSRAGNNAFSLPLRFPFPFPTSLSVDRVPHLFNLVVSKDQYHRFVILLATGRSARIFEVSLGTVTQQITVPRPEEKVRVGREWTRQHYQNYRKEKERQFIKEKVSVLSRLVYDNDHSHLILTGEPRYVSAVRRALPKRLADRLADVLTLPNSVSGGSLLTETIQAFMQAEDRESQSAVEQLMSAYYRDELALLGIEETLGALLREEVDSLVIAADYDLGVVQICEVCNWLSLADAVPEICLACGSASLQTYNTREELVRLAEQQYCRIETVAKSVPLCQAGGVGCLLRYKRM